MHLKLNLNGSVEPLAKYLKNFEKIKPSLLLEIDTVRNEFVAKTFSIDRATVRYSSISFGNCNITIAEHEGASELGENRIRAAIFMELPKVIRILNRFSDEVDDKKNPNFMIDIEYSKVATEGEGGVPVFAATSTSFISNKLKMKVDGYRLSELKYLSDEKFFGGVFHVEDAVSLDLTAATIASIVETSDIIKIDPKKDALMFYVDGTDVYVCDYIRKDANGIAAPANFEYKIGTVPAAEYPISATINREKFMQAMAKTDEDFRVILGRRKSKATGEYVVDRILFDSNTTQSKVAISVINEN